MMVMVHYNHPWKETETAYYYYLYYYVTYCNCLHSRSCQLEYQLSSVSVITSVADVCMRSESINNELELRAILISLAEDSYACTVN